MSYVSNFCCQICFDNLENVKFDLFLFVTFVWVKFKVCLCQCLLYEKSGLLIKRNCYFTRRFLKSGRCWGVCWFVSNSLSISLALVVWITTSTFVVKNICILITKHRFKIQILLKNTLIVICFTTVVVSNHPISGWQQWPTYIKR